MGKPKNYCDLCHVKNKAWIHGSFFGITSCKNHFGQSLIVLNEHRAELTEEEKQEMEWLVQKHWPGYKPCKKETLSKDHFSQHYIRN